MPKPFPPFEIAKPGQAVATSGVQYDFTPTVLAELAETYDPARHDAPIVVGHPKNNSPAYGWVKSVQWDPAQKRLIATPRDVSRDFAEAVERKQFPKRSMSIYLPNSPGNPVPGKHVLRHVGFLGALPPAIKGLADVSFAETEDGVLEFAEADDTVVAQVIQNLREWLLTSQGSEVADKIVPADAVAFLLQSAVMEASQDAPGAVNCSETPSSSGLAEREAALAQKERELQAKLDDIKRKEYEDFAESLVADGCRLLPRDKSGLVEFLASQEEGVLEFAEAEGGKIGRLDWLKDFLRRIPRQVDFGEFDGQGNRDTVVEANPLVADAERRANTSK